MAQYKTIAATLLAVSSLSAGESWHKARTAGQIVLAAMATVDIGSSVRLREVNPITGPSSRFGFRQGAVLGGMSAGSLLAQWWMLRHRETPALDR